MIRTLRLAATASVGAALFAAPASAIRQPDKDTALKPSAALDVIAAPAPEKREYSISRPRVSGTVGSPAWGSQLIEFFKANPLMLGLKSTPDLRVDYIKTVSGTNGLSDRMYVNLVQVVHGVDVHGTGLSFSLNPAGKDLRLDDLRVQLYPDLISVPAGPPDVNAGTPSMQRRARSSRVQPLQRKIRWIQGRWRDVQEYAVQDLGLHGAVDGSGQAYLWDDRLYATYSGKATGRQVNFDPVATGSALNEVPLPSLKISDVGGTPVFTDAAGAFSFSTTSSGNIPVGLVGKWGIVNDAGGGANLSVAIPGGSPSPVTLQFNGGTGSVESNTAQVNGYRHTTLIHDWLVAQGVQPAGINTAIPVYVNLVPITCNAYYDFTSINFLKSGGGCINSAYDTVIYHEYGHFVDDKIGGIIDSGLSEGWGDVMATYITGQPVVGEGFFGTPGSAIRNANNTYVYNPSDGDPHMVGQAWMGFAWDLRTNLIALLGPSAGAALAENLVIPVLLANSPDIPSAVRQVALRDDDDGNLLNGTPHFTQILAAASRHGLGGVFDTTPPAVAINTPAPNATLSGLATVSGTAADTQGIANVSILLDNAPQGVATGKTSWSFQLDTLSVVNGTHTLTARAEDTAGNTKDVSIPVNVNNTGNGSVTYNATLKAPQCVGVASSCNSGTLLNSRALLSGASELHQPNTLLSSCLDGTAGAYHQDESNDRIKVSTLDGTPFAPGKVVRIEATVWAYSAYTSDSLDLYYTANASAPAWVYLKTIVPSAAGAQVLSATYTLPSGSMQAVRANFRYVGSPSVCSSNGFDDHDDLVFQVGGAETNPPSAPGNVALSSATSFSLMLTWAASTDDVGVSGYRVDLSTSPLFTHFVSPYSNYDAGLVTSQLISGLTPSTTYFARVRAYDASLNTSSSSAVAQGTTRPGLGPDMTITKFVITPSGAIAPSGAYQMTITVKNQGGSSAFFPSTMAVYFDRNAEPSWSGLTTPPIPAGGERTFTFNGTAPSVERLYGLRAYVFGPDAESDTTNNNAYTYLTVTTSGKTETFLSNLPWISMTSDSIPARRDFNVLGSLMTLNNATYYTKGIGTQANTTIVFPLPADQYCSFSTVGGIDVEAGPTGSVHMEALADEAPVFYATFTGGAAPISSAKDLKRHSRLTLITTDNGDGNIKDYADWALARLYCSLVPDTAPPVITSVNTLVTSTSTATITWYTAEYANSVIEFGETSGYGRVYGNNQDEMLHSMVLDQLPSGTTIHFRISGTDAFGNTGVSGDLTFFMPGRSSSGSATFIKTDDVTQGNWKGTYGAEGYGINSDALVFPSYAPVHIMNSLSYVWAPATPEIRALQKSVGAERIASTWYSGSNFNIDLTLTDGTTHQLALYLIDWDSFGGGRSQTVQLSDADGHVLDVRTVSNFTGGKYLVWQVKGHVVITVLNQNPASNAVVSGIFFGEGGSTPPGETVWVEDQIPTGAIPSAEGGDAWTWTAASPGPFSGSLASPSTLSSGMHQHYFHGATSTLAVNPGDSLSAYVYLDLANPPSQVMLQWNDGTWEHRAYWGSNQIPWGVDGTESRRYMGPLPPAGQWIKLSVPASLVGLEGHILNGLAFTLFDGRASWDHAGKIAAVGTPSLVGSPLPAPNFTPPAQIGLDGDVRASYDPRIPVASYQWTISVRNPMAITGTIPPTVPPIRVATAGAAGSLSLKSVPALPGNYQISVAAITVDGRLSPSSQANVAFVNAAVTSAASPRVFPNPWRVQRDEATNITFDQMNLGSTVKIFTVSGHSVASLPAPNGTASWDLKNTSGDHVASGPYLYLITDPQGNKTRGKLAIIR